MEKSLQHKSHRCLLIYILCFGAVLSVLYVFRIAHTTPRYIRQAYAGWTTADLIVLYSSVNKAAPSSWGDLYRISDQASNFTFRAKVDELEANIWVDWDALQQLYNNPDQTNRALIIMDNKKKQLRIHWEGAEPNDIVTSYFRSEERKGSASEPLKRETGSALE